jgi:hypothetical protein
VGSKRHWRVCLDVSLAVYVNTEDDVAQRVGANVASMLQVGALLFDEPCPVWMERVQVTDTVLLDGGGD